MTKRIYIGIDRVQEERCGISHENEQERYLGADLPGPIADLLYSALVSFGEFGQALVERNTDD